jgi:hypothetical protein
MDPSVDRYDPENRFLHVPTSVVVYLASALHPWDHTVMLDSVERRVTLLGDKLPMDDDLDGDYWMEPRCWQLGKLRTVLDQMLPNIPRLKPEYELARIHLTMWMVEATFRKGYLR